MSFLFRDTFASHCEIGTLSSESTRNDYCVAEHVQRYLLGLYNVRSRLLTVIVLLRRVDSE